MSAEAENIDKNVEKIAQSIFKMQKVAISYTITKAFPFLQLLRDHGYITNKTYEASKESFKKGPKKVIVEVVYDVLAEAEKKFDLHLLKALFNKLTLKNYPDLNHIYKIFKNEIPDKNFFPESDAEGNKKSPDIQSSLEEVTNIDDSIEFGDKDEPPEASASELKGKPESKKHGEDKVDFSSDILPVTCKNMKGKLYVNKLKEGARSKCIRSEDGNWLTLKEFKVAGGYNKSSNWNQCVYCGGRTIKWLMENGKLPNLTGKNDRKEKK